MNEESWYVKDAYFLALVAWIQAAPFALDEAAVDLIAGCGIKQAFSSANAEQLDKLNQEMEFVWMSNPATQEQAVMAYLVLLDEYLRSKEVKAQALDS